MLLTIFIPDNMLLRVNPANNCIIRLDLNFIIRVDSQSYTASAN